jgi:hypothetical protein
MSLTIEASTWDEDQLKEELAIRMPSKWYFSLVPNEELNRWVLLIFNDGIQEWRGEGIHTQLVLLDAIGWVEARVSPTPEGSPWRRKRGEISQVRIHDYLFSKVSTKEDPLDLTPTEVDSLYSSRTKE